MTLNRIYIPLLVILSLAAFRPPEFIKAFELKLYDLLVYHSAPNVADPRVVIVGIDENSLDEFGRWPWPRNIIGELIGKLGGFGAKVTALDMTFTTEADKASSDVADRVGALLERNGIPPRYPAMFKEFEKIREDISRDKSLEAAMSGAGNVVTGFLFHKNEGFSEEVRERKREGIRPYRIKLVRRTADTRGLSIESGYTSAEPNISIIQEASAATGFLNVTADRDGIFRAYPMLIEYRGDFYPSLALAAAMLYEGTLESAQVYFGQGFFQGVILGDRLVHTDEEGIINLRYLGPDGTFPVISAADVIKAPLTDKRLREALSGKIAFVGATATQIKDLRATPFGYTAGINVQANAAAAALNDLSISKHKWQSAYDAILTMVIGAALLFILQRVGVYAGLALTLLLFAGLAYFNFHVFSAYNVWLNSVIPATTLAVGFVTVTVYQYVAEQKSKRFIKDTFGHYLSPKVINQIIENPGLLRLGGENRVMTAFFSDVAGFTTISEKLAPAELVALLNEYLSAMTDIIIGLDGTVDKYEGDAIIAFWGAPVEMDNHAELCVLAAVMMQRKLVEMREAWRKEGKNELNVRMGINTGPMVVGNMGSKTRMDYTMMGDAVNLASRLEGTNKYYGTSIMISGFTHSLVKNRFFCRELDMVRVAGKKDAIRLYEVIEEKERVSEKRRRHAEDFEKALAAFRALDLDSAKKLFSALDGGDRACELYIGRIEALLKNPPVPGWDRVYDLAK